MRQFVYKGLAVLALVVLIDLAVGVISDRVFTSLPDKNSMIATIQQSLFNKTADLLVLGPSTANHHYDAQLMTDSLGMDVYNAGLDGRDMIYFGVVLQSYFDRCGVKMVILDVGPTQLDGSWLAMINDTKPYYGISKQVTEYYDNETDWQQRLKLFSSLYRYNKTLSYWIRVQIDPVNDTKGYVPLERVLDTLELSETNEFTVDSTEYRYFVNIVDMCKKNNATLVVVQSPSADRNLAFENWVASFCEKNHIVCIQEIANEEYYKHPEWFQDGAHLNSAGACVFSRKIVNALKQNTTIFPN